MHPSEQVLLLCAPSFAKFAPLSYLAMYCGLMVFASFLYSVGYVAYVYGALRASRSIHVSLVQSVLGTTLR